MPSPQRLQTAVPLDQQSVMPAVRGVPWWGAVLLATGITALGAAIDAGSNDSLGGIYKFCYLVGCVVAALAVRRRALFTAAAQPPLIAFFVGIVTLYGLNSEQASSGLKSLIFKVLLPIAADFPWMLTVFLVTLALVLVRWFLTRGEEDQNSGGRTKPTGTRSASTSRASRDKAARAKTGEPTERATTHRRAKSSAAQTGAGQTSKSPTSRSRPQRSRPSSATERPSTSARTATVERTTAQRTPAATRPTVADLAAPDLTPSDAPLSGQADTPRTEPAPSGFQAYESATDAGPAGVADTRS
ncbi:hypothetical protein RD149_11300 [Gordonia westfalica]|uniref:DUF6542 domain-containing protein n=1 Tax=Gordonia westfalica TaxID=158898 RepID=A0ABU2GSA7_9ACTN|nr:DUF6542 domain-containing protein [Gordonia westfalica]MDS1114351.1 hypothetical protein [Gordonia westfalica]